MTVTANAAVRAVAVAGRRVPAAVTGRRRCRSSATPTAPAAASSAGTAARRRRRTCRTAATSSAVAAAPDRSAAARTTLAAVSAAAVRRWSIQCSTRGVEECELLPDQQVLDDRADRPSGCGQRHDDHGEAQATAQPGVEPVAEPAQLEVVAPTDPAHGRGLDDTAPQGSQPVLAGDDPAGRPPQHEPQGDQPEQQQRRLAATRSTVRYDAPPA